MGISKVEIKNSDGTKNVLVDLTGDTVTSDTLLKGVTAHGADGETITGAYSPNMGNMYVWGKYLITQGISESEESDVTLSYKLTSVSNDWDNADYSDEIEIVNGSLSLVNPSTVNIKNQSSAESILGKYVRLYVSTTKPYYRIPSTATISYSHDTSSEYKYSVSTAYKLSVGGNEKGKFVENVISENIDSYPQDGEQDGYWYVHKGLLKNLIDESGGTTTPSLQEKTVSPSESSQLITPDTGYDGLSKVTVNAISPTYVGSEVTKKTESTYTPGVSDQKIDKNQYLSGDQTIKGDTNLISENIKSGISIFGVNGTYEGGSSVGSGDDNCEAYHITDKSTALDFKRTDGDIKVWGYGYYSASTYSRTIYTFVGDGYYTSSMYGTPSKTSATFSVDSNGRLSGLPSNLTKVDLLVTKGI